MSIRQKILLWRYRATMADLNNLLAVALKAIADRRRKADQLAGRLAREGIQVQATSAEDVRRDIERQLKLGVLQ